MVYPPCLGHRDLTPIPMPPSTVLLTLPGTAQQLPRTSLSACLSGVLSLCCSCRRCSPGLPAWHVLPLVCPVCCTSHATVSLPPGERLLPPLSQVPTLGISSWEKTSMSSTQWARPATRCAFVPGNGPTTPVIRVPTPPPPPPSSPNPHCMPLPSPLSLSLFLRLSSPCRFPLASPFALSPLATYNAPT